jgi:ribosomal protein L7/L12
MAIAKAEILEAIAQMTVLELSSLIKEMEEKFGVSAAAADEMLRPPILCLLHVMSQPANFERPSRLQVIQFQPHVESKAR